MSAEELDRVARLRQEFDDSFARARAELNDSHCALLAISVAGQAYALRLSDVLGLYTGKRITALPSRAPELLGIAGFRGVMLPVYDLRALLGHATVDAPAWLVVASSAPIAFAFDRFERHVRVLPSDIAAVAGSSGMVRAVAHAEGESRPIVQLEALVSAIAQRTSQHPVKER